MIMIYEDLVLLAQYSKSMSYNITNIPKKKKTEVEGSDQFRLYVES